MDLCRKGLGSQNFIFKDPVETKAKNGKFLSLFLKCHSGSSNTNIIIITARSRKAIQEPGSDGAHLLVPALGRQRQAVSLSSRPAWSRQAEFQDKPQSYTKKPCREKTKVRDQEWENSAESN